MKTLTTIVISLMLLAGMAFAAGIDGKWVSERKVNGPNGEMTIKQVFELKADGDKLTGSVSMTTPQGERKSDISEGKVEGNKFSFKVTTESQRGKMTTVYSGTVEGDSLKGTSLREGGQGQAREFTATKQ